MVAVSVVVPTYERPDHLRGAVETALGQTFDSLEVVVVDDGSATDYAARTAADYDRVRCVTHDENRGAAAARNTGIDAADGSYVAFLDDDDRWHESKIRRQVALLDREPDAGIATCLMTSVTADGEPVTCEASTPGGDLSDATLLDNAVGSPSRVLVRAGALDGVRFDESLPTKHDWDLFLRLCQDWPVAVVPAHLYVRVSHGSLTSDPGTVERDRLAVLRKHEGRIRERGLWQRALAAYHTNVGRKYLGVGDRSGARGHLRRAAVGRPTPRRLALLALTLAPRSAFRAAIACKRTAQSVRNDCPDAAALARSVPGFPGAGA